MGLVARDLNEFTLPKDRIWKLDLYLVPGPASNAGANEQRINLRGGTPHIIAEPVRRTYYLVDRTRSATWTRLLAVGDSGCDARISAAWRSRSCASFRRPVFRRMEADSVRMSTIAG